ncbi:hypothetical protein JCM14036_16270 [Desulfotomaculum defluvii]
MQCKDALNMLSPYLDKVLNSDECTEVRVHLASCPKCKAEYEELKIAMLLLQELPEMTPPVDFHAKLMAKIDDIEIAKKQIQQKGWLSNVRSIAKSNWYRSAAVAAVMVMTLGISSLWQKEGNTILPVVINDKEIIITEQEPQITKTNKTQQTDKPVSEKDQKPDTGVSSPIIENSEEKGKDTAVSNKPVTSVPVKPVTQNPVIKQVESFVPRPSEGLVASSATLKLDVDQVEESLKVISQIVQSNGALIYSTYAGSNEGGTLEIKVARNSYGTICSSLQKVGAVVTFLPLEKDLSTQHKEATECLIILKQKQAELEQQLTENPNDMLSQQLEQINNDLIEQINVIKQIEERSTYSLITLIIM